MTMSHLLKQTKKCCVKIIRKLSFTPSATTPGSGGGRVDQSPTHNGHGLNNRITAKYVLHKNCTPTRCKVQPCEGSTAFDEPPSDGWFETEARSGGPAFYSELADPDELRRSSSPPIPETQNNYRASRDTKNLPKKRTNITGNKNVNLRKCFRLRSKTFDGPAAGGGVGALDGSGAQGGRGSTPSVVEGGGGGLPAEGPARVPDSQTLASNNSSSRLIGAKLDKISKSLMRSSASDGEMAVGSPPPPSSGVAPEPGSTNHHHHYKLAKPLFLTNKKHRRSNYNHIEADAGDDGEFDDVEEAVAEDRGDEYWRRSQPPYGEELILTASSGAQQPTTAYSRERLEEQETTLTVGESSSTAAAAAAVSNAPSVLERLTVAETAAAILFEKVKYDRTKRYLIDQLTEGDTNPPGSPSLEAAAFQLSASCSSSPFHLAMAAAVASKSRDDFVDPWKNYNIRGGASWDKVSKSPWDLSAKASPVRSHAASDSAPSPAVPVATFQATSPTQQQQQRHGEVVTPTYPTRSHWNPFEYSPAHLSRLGSGQQTQPTSPQRKHQPQHQPQQQQYRPAFQVQTDVWENLNNKHYEIDTDVVWRSTRCSSRRTSASTVETWIDDETFDNSFNEELERRCATLKICE